MIRQDYLLRMIDRATQALVRMLRRRDRGDLDGARQEATEVYDALGIPPELAGMLTAETLAEMLGDPDKMRLMARLFQQEAEVFRASGDPLSSTARYVRATELMLEVRVLDPQPDDAGVLQELFRHIPTNALADKYRDAG